MDWKYDAANYGGGDGSSFEEAVKILLKSTGKGISAEKAYLNHRFGEYPGWEQTAQILSNQGDKVYDVIHIRIEGVLKEEVFFDITDFFGK
jgi:hypothetical protein